MYSQSGYRVTESAGTSVMLRGKLNRAALHSAMSTLSSIIESVRRLASLTPTSERESEPTRRMFSRPSAPGAQPERSGAAGQCFGGAEAPGAGGGVSVGSAFGSGLGVAPATSGVGAVEATMAVGVALAVPFAESDATATGGTVCSVKDACGKAP